MDPKNDGPWKVHSLFQIWNHFGYLNVKFRGVSNIRKCNLFGALPLPITVEMKVNWNENCDDRGGDCTWERGHPNT